MARPVKLTANQGVAMLGGVDREEVQSQQTQLTTTAETVIAAAGGAGIFHDLMSLRLANSSATQVTVAIRRAVAGLIIENIVLAAGATFGFHGGPDGALPALAANAAWTAQASGAVTAVEITTHVIKRTG